MDSVFLQEYSDLIDNELQAVIKNLNNVPESSLWETRGTITNSAGVLAQHLTGNLNHYIGYALGNTDYTRNRDIEFERSNKTKADLADALEKTRLMIQNVIPSLDAERLNKPFPIENAGSVSTSKMLLKIIQHLSYHSGQLNYLSRILS